MLNLQQLNKIKIVILSHNTESIILDNQYISSYYISKQEQIGQSWTVALKPIISIYKERGKYIYELLKEDDYVFIFTTTGDGEDWYCAGGGLIDGVTHTITMSDRGFLEEEVIISGSGWEKSFKKTALLTDPWLADGLLEGQTTTGTRINLGNIRQIINTLPIFNIQAKIAIKRITEEIMSSSDTTRVKQYLLPYLNNVSIYDYIHSEVDDDFARTYMYIDVPQWQSQIQNNLMNFVLDFSNTDINCVIFDLQNSATANIPYANTTTLFDTNSSQVSTNLSTALPSLGNLLENVTPVMYIYKRPVFLEEYINIPNKNNNILDIKQYNFKYEFTKKPIENNIVYLEPTNLSGMAPPGRVLLARLTQEYSDDMLKNINIHGMRVKVYRMPFWQTESNSPGIDYTDSGSPIMNPTQLEYWAHRLLELGIYADQLYSVNISLLGIHKFFIGNPIKVHTLTKSYYGLVESVSYRWQINGAPVTQLGINYVWENSNEL